MDYIVRLPLVDFNITNQYEISKNWTWIQKAVEYSSESMYREIKDSDYASLNSKVKLKIYKFLLRGRYRATPFGFWAGVGLGEWANQSSYHISPEYNLLPETTNDFNYLIENQGHVHATYVINPSLCILPNAFRYYDYERHTQKWVCRILDKNSILDAVISCASPRKQMDFAGFVSCFESDDIHRIKSIWSSVLETGLLHPSKQGIPFKTDTTDKNRADSILKHPIQLSHKINKRLSLIQEEMGALFIPSPNQVLVNFAKWFEDQFDDRQVLLSDVARHPDFSMDQFTSTKDGRQQEKSISLLNQKRWEGMETLDLSEHYPKLPLPKEVHLDAVFRVLDPDAIILENLVCDRPFVYTGRFSRDQKIHAYLRNAMLPEMKETDLAIHAELLLFESEKANYISATNSFLAKKICLFTQTTDPSILNADDIYIGLADGKFRLFDQNLEKIIMPVVQHPLNPSQISHPLTRLVWEIAHQSIRKFLVYSDPVFTDPPYIPRITWKDQVIQGKRWRLEAESYRSADDLAGFLEAQKLPHPFLAGAHDLELLLHWRRQDDLQVLWEELKKRRNLYLFEVPWIARSPFKSENGEPQYPQFISKIQVAENAPSRIPAKNPQLNKDAEWIYLQIAMADHQLSSFIRKALPELISDIPENLLPEKWFYLVYPSPTCQIRIRFQVASSLQSDFNRWIIPKLVNQNGSYSVKTRSYYPEYRKYSFDCLAISSTLFHMESCLLMGDIEKLKDGLIHQSSQHRALAVLELWKAILSTHPFPHILHKEFKAYIDQLPMHSLKRVKKSEQPGETSFLPQKFLNSYVGIFQKHSWFSEPEKCNKLLTNHLHMLVNRTFHLAAREHEEQLVYWLYKTLARRIYCSKGDTPAQNHPAGTIQDRKLPSPV